MSGLRPITKSICLQVMASDITVALDRKVAIRAMISFGRLKILKFEGWI